VQPDGDEVRASLRKIAMGLDKPIEALLAAPVICPDESHSFLRARTSKILMPLAREGRHRWRFALRNHRV
jgi:hypothetical protein